MDSCGLRSVKEAHCYKCFRQQIMIRVQSVNSQSHSA